MGNLTPELAALRDETRDLAKSYGLDCYEVIFELVDHDELNMIASFGGFPTRYPHWRFGMEYEHLTKSYAYGLSKIYELVINNDPCYAYLMRSNALTEQKLVMAHVYGHCDFFKNNAWFQHTSRKMMDVLANHGARIRRYMDRYGQERVENFIDVVHSLDNLIDPYSPYIDRGGAERTEDHTRGRGCAAGRARRCRKIAAKDYMDRYINPPSSSRASASDGSEGESRASSSRRGRARRVEVPARTRAARDVGAGRARDAARGGLLLRPAGHDQDHERGVGRVLAQPADDAAPAATPARSCSTATTHSGTLSTRPGQINPYKIGVELFRAHRGALEPAALRRRVRRATTRKRRQWNEPTNQGRAEGVRGAADLQRRHVHRRVRDARVRRGRRRCSSTGRSADGQLVIVDRDYRKVKKQLLAALTNFGNPIIKVVDGNYKNRGELYLVHEWVGGDLQIEMAQLTLQGLCRMWQRPVHIETIESGKGRLLSYDGKNRVEQRSHREPPRDRTRRRRQGSDSVNPRPTLERVWIVYLIAVLAAGVLAGGEVQCAQGRKHLVLHAGLLAAVLAVGQVAKHRSPAKARFWRGALALFGLPAVFSAMAWLLPRAYPEPWEYVWLQWDRAVFGTDIALLADRWLAPPCVELLQVVYASFYFIPIAAVLSAWRRCGWAVFDRAMFLFVSGFLASYLGYVLVPTLSPQLVLAHAAEPQGPVGHAVPAARDRRRRMQSLQLLPERPHDVDDREPDRGMALEPPAGSGRCCRSASC
jgi:stage V sporulation protein R